MAVYLIRAGENGPVKIGSTNDLQRRLPFLQTGQHEQLHVLRLWKGGLAEERLLHRKFSDHRIRSEWFSFVPEMLGDVGLEEIAPEAKAGPDLSYSLVGLITRAGGVNALAAKLGVSHSSICDWKRIYQAGAAPGCCTLASTTSIPLTPPVAPPITPHVNVPEPAGLWVLLVGAAALAVLRRRDRHAP